MSIMRPDQKLITCNLLYMLVNNIINEFVALIITDIGIMITHA